MVNSQAEILQNIEKRLEEITKIVIQRQNQNTKDLFIDDEDFQYIMEFCSKTLTNWKKESFLDFREIDGKIAFSIESIKKMLSEQFGALKKK